jgi:hypothetical protein
MSISSNLSVAFSSLLIASALVFVEAPVALACSAGGAGSSGVSHGSAMHPGSVTVCVGVQETTPAATIPAGPKPPTGIINKPVPRPVCPTAAQRKQIPSSPDAAERWIKAVCAPSKPLTTRPVPSVAPVTLSPVATTYSSAAVSFKPNPLKATAHPGSKIVAGGTLTLRSNPSLHHRSQLILGRQAEVRFSPAWLGWQFSDGTRIQGVNIKRSFEQAGKYRAWAIASYFVSYRLVGETAWQSVAGQISVLSNVLEIEVSAKIPPAQPKPPELPKPPKPPKLLLVGGECSANPISWGCTP